MGIKHLHQLLQKYAPNCYEKKHLSEFSYKRVAIDISLYLYKYKAISGDRWMESFVYLISCLRKWNIHCVSRSVTNTCFVVPTSSGIQRPLM